MKIKTMFLEKKKLNFNLSRAMADAVFYDHFQLMPPKAFIV